MRMILSFCQHRRSILRHSIHMLIKTSHYLPNLVSLQWILVNIEEIFILESVILNIHMFFFSINKIRFTCKSKLILNNFLTLLYLFRSSSKQLHFPVAIACSLPTKHDALFRNILRFQVLSINPVYYYVHNCGLRPRWAPFSPFGIYYAPLSPSFVCCFGDLSFLFLSFSFQVHNVE